MIIVIRILAIRVAVELRRLVVRIERSSGIWRIYWTLTLYLGPLTSAMSFALRNYTSCLIILFVNFVFFLTGFALMQRSSIGSPLGHQATTSKMEQAIQEEWERYTIIGIFVGGVISAVIVLVVSTARIMP